MSPVKLYWAGADEVAVVEDHMQVLAVCAACSMIAVAAVAGAGAGAAAGALISCARAWCDSVHHNGALKCLMPLCELLCRAGTVRNVRRW